MKNPENIIFYSKSLNKSFTEQDLFDYYKKYKDKILPFVLYKTVGLVLATDIVNSPSKTEKRLVFVRRPILSEEDYDKYIANGRVVEVYVELVPEGFNTTDVGIIDIDCGEKVDFDLLKNLIQDFIIYLTEEEDFDTFKLIFTGGRGFHIYITLNKQENINTIREYLKEVISDYIEKSQFIKKHNLQNKITLSAIKNEDEIRFDLSSMKIRGTFRVPYSLHAETGLSATEVSIQELPDFDLNDANKIDELNVIASENVFSIVDSLVKKYIGETDLLSKKVEDVFNIEEVKQEAPFSVKLIDNFKDNTIKELMDRIKYVNENIYMYVINKLYDVLVENYFKIEKKASINFYRRLKKGQQGIYTIQQHDAKRAGKHFDLRLEVPKTDDLQPYYEKRDVTKTPEPTTKLQDKSTLMSFAIRHLDKLAEGKKNKVLAINVEDHPYSYKDFEGVIPEGYGEGRVQIVDSGQYIVEDKKGTVILLKLKSNENSEILLKLVPIKEDQVLLIRME